MRGTPDREPIVGTTGASCRGGHKGGGNGGEGRSDHLCGGCGGAGHGKWGWHGFRPRPKDGAHAEGRWRYMDTGGG